VVLENAGHYFRLEISDSGRGISAEFLPHLFNRFSQADGSYSRRHGGLGLGLAIVRHLVELHGGTVMGNSEGEGKGSVFTVFLPQNTTDQELDSARDLAQLQNNEFVKAPMMLKGIKILLVDDEPDSLRLTRFVLERCGALIQMADNAEQGFQAMKEWRPDVLISDISMPGESGYELIRRIRYLGVDGDIPAIALTALGGVDHKNMALDAGFQLYIPKPLEPNLLVESIVELLQKTAIQK
jgi:CheY-like chemotaxis protein